MTTPVGPLVLVAGPIGLRAVLWPGEDGSRVDRAVGPREDTVDARTPVTRGAPAGAASAGTAGGRGCRPDRVGRGG